MATGRMADRFLGGSRPRFAAALIGLLVVGLAAAGLAFTGQFSDLRHANIPWIHPYPPSGYELNPLNPANKDDLINLAEASRVRADFLDDGKMELDALATGNTALLEQSTTGSFLIKLKQRQAQDSAEGILEKEQNELGAVVVGHLADPATPGVYWCVQETGSGTLTYVSKSTGQVLRESRFKSVSKFWLVRSGGRYLITDAQISARNAQ